MKKNQLIIVQAILSFVLVVIIMLPGLSQASITASGSAKMSWDINGFQNSVNVNWLDPTLTDTRGSLSAAAVTLNGTYEPYGTDNIDGAPWGNTGFSTTLADSSGSVNGSASTAPDTGTQMASSSILLNSGSASVDIAQSVLIGQFMVATPTTLDILASYALLMNLINDVSVNTNSYVDVSVGLTLSNFDVTDPLTGQSLVLAADSRFFSRSLTGLGSNSFSYDSADYVPLHLTYQLQPGITYDFEAQASTKASVPEPMTLILLLSGLMGLMILRKRFE